MTGGYEVPTLFGAPAKRDEPAPQRPPESPAAIEASPGMRFMAQLADEDIDEAQVEAALSDFPTFRWADAEGSLEAVDGVPALLSAERRRLRKRVGAALAVLAVLVFASLLVDPQGGVFSPDEVSACYDLAFRQSIAAAVAPSDLLDAGEIAAVHERYFRVLERVGITLSAVLCGAAVCVGGLLFQSSFRREWAVAPIAGVSVAVLVGQGIAVLAVGSTLGISWVALLVACVLGLALAVALRFRLNALNLTDEGARQLGVDAVRLRRVADGCAIVLLVAGQVRMGPIFPLALVVPPLARNLFGVEFRQALVGTALLGAVALLLASLVPIPVWITAAVIAGAVVAHALVSAKRSRENADAPTALH